MCKPGDEATENGPGSEDVFIIMNAMQIYIVLTCDGWKFNSYFAWKMEFLI